MGPLLFNIYINDVFNSLVESDSVIITAYADDLAVGICSRDAQELYTVAQSILNNLNNWFNNNSISINIDKSQFMLVKSTHDQPLCISGSRLNSTVTFNYLGVLLDAELKWTTHLQLLSTKLSRSCFIFRQIRGIFPFGYLKTIYHGVFESHLRYGIRFWGHVNTYPLLVIQKRCLRFMLGLNRYESCRKHFKERGLITVTCLYIFEVINFVHQNKGEVQGRTQK